MAETVTLPICRPSNSLARGRYAVLAAAFLGLMFDGIELGLMPVASLSVSQGLLGDDYTEALGGHWFAWFTAALMLGAAIGGSLLGQSRRPHRPRPRDGRQHPVLLALRRPGRVRHHVANKCSLLRFLVGLGVGGMWPNGVALVAECWPTASRPTVSGVLGAGINVGILCLSQLGRLHPITPDSWRWIFMLAAVPAVLGVVVLALLPESPKWLASRGQSKKPGVPLRTLFRGELLRPTLVGILLASVPLVGAWAGSKWMIPWADAVGGTEHPGYKVDDARVVGRRRGDRQLSRVLRSPPGSAGAFRTS